MTFYKKRGRFAVGHMHESQHMTLSLLHLKFFHIKTMLPLGVNKHMDGCSRSPVMDWHGVSIVYSQLTLSVPEKVSDSTTNLTRIKWSLNMNECSRLILISFYIV